MPRILINEKDKTSPGLLSNYANYAVLIPGFTGEGFIEYSDAVSYDKPVKPDNNNVYEFNSVQDFESTIGLRAPEVLDTESNKIIYHYGNQMAYELLTMGYSIVYKPITKVSEIANASFWEIFKDRASYDFRFISHGLLESSLFDDSEEYEEKVARLALVKAAIAELAKIEADIEAGQPTNPDLEKAEAYLLVQKDFEGFLDQTGKDYYPSFAEAVVGTNLEANVLEQEIAAIQNGGISESLINNVNGFIANLARYVTDDSSFEDQGRGDCIALIELDERSYVSNTSTAKAEERIIDGLSRISQINASNGKYCALTVPSVYYKMSDDIRFANTEIDLDNRVSNKKFPGAFHYLACFMNSLRSGFAEWYAAAGYTRGVSSYVVDHASVKLGEIAINALEPRQLYTDGPKFACNVIASFRGSYYLWGNRTAHPLTNEDLVASHFLNIRQLCTTIKKQLYVACRRFTFDPNSDTLWFNFVNAIRPTLEAMKADQGIRDYKVLKVYSDKKATMKAKIRIIPIEAVEDFDIEVSLEDSFGETAAVVYE